MANTKLRVTVDKSSHLIVRQGPSKSTKELHKLKNGDTIDSNKKDGNWYCVKAVNGFANSAYSGGWVNGNYVKVTKSEILGSNNSGKNKKKNSKAKKVTARSQTVKYTKAISSYSDVDKNAAKKMMAKNLSGIWGIPYQFMRTVDRRVDGTNFGRKYAEKIVSRMPLVFFQPCKPTYMPTFNKKSRNAMVNALGAVANGATGGEIKQLLNRDGRYYTTVFAYAEYYKYVNPMCNMCATLLGLKNKKVKIGNHTGKLGTFDWSKATSNAFKSYFTAKETIPFYIDSDTSISESFSNSTTESSLASKVNGVSDLAREVQFLMGNEAGVDIAALTQDKYDATQKSVNKIAKKYSSAGNLIRNVSAQFTTVATGGKLVFPEIWSDSEFSRSYDINIKLRSPDCDVLSLYLNILVPYIMVMGISVCRQFGANGYKSPFLIRAFYKGIFNIDCGIVTGMSVTRGKEGSWSADNIPSEMDISLSIKDLYSSMSISNNKDIGKMINNTALMDYLCNMCGINLAQPEIARTIEVYLMLHKSKVRQSLNSVWSALEQEVGNLFLQGTLARYLI